MSLPRIRTSALYLRVPRVDWTRVVRGEKTELRTRSHPARPKPDASDYKTPTPVVIYSYPHWREGRDPDTKLMVLAAGRVEALGAISDASLAAEGYSTRKDFRRYWTKERDRPWAPLEPVSVWTLRAPASREELGAMLLERLYGDFLL